MMAKCEWCKKREEVLEFADSVTDFAHGFIAKICRQCYIEKIEKELKAIQENLKKEKELLKEEQKK